MLATPAQKVLSYTELVSINFKCRNNSTPQINRAKRAGIRSLIATIRHYQQEQ